MLEARNITVCYGPCAVVADVSLRIAPGTVTAIAGPNGAGKSTLLRALNGTLTPSQGVVLLEGQDLRQLARRAVSRRVAVVAQEAELRFPVTVLEFVLGGRYGRHDAGGFGWETEKDLAIARQVLTETDLHDYETRLMNELSGGERQRAVLARALATDAPLLLLDEPTANLDLAHQATMLALVRARCDGQRRGAVFVTHDVNLAGEFADEIILLRQGRILFSGPPVVALTPELLHKLFGVTVLVDAHPVTGAPRVTPIYGNSHKKH